VSRWPIQRLVELLKKTATYPIRSWLQQSWSMFGTTVTLICKLMPQQVINCCRNSDEDERRQD